jgi:hypothetical protein
LFVPEKSSVNVQVRVWLCLAATPQGCENYGGLRIVRRIQFAHHMTRSRKKNPAGGITMSASDMPGKVQGHRKTRRAVRSALASSRDELPDRKKTENPYSYPKDGKRWYGKRDPAARRK